MGVITPHNRKSVIALAAIFGFGLGAYGLSQVYPPLGVISGTMSPAQRYVESLTDGEIPAHGRYVLVDAASARLFMIEDGRVRDSMKVIVGKPDTPTPALKSIIHYATLKPYWHVTPDLVRTIIAPRVLQEGDAYLTQRGYEIVSAFAPDAKVIPPEGVDWEAVAAGTQEILVRQRPGPANSLGNFKFELTGGDGIYLHDTPKKELFAQDQRYLSHGCVRLQDAPRFARWVLGGDPPLGIAPPESHLLVRGGVPITIAYLGARAQTQLAGLQ